MKIKLVEKVTELFRSFSDSLSAFILLIFLAGVVVTYFMMATIVVAISTFFKFSRKDYL